MENLLNHDNLSLLSSRMTKGETFAHVHVASNPSEVICLSSKTSNNSYVYLLWLKPADGEDQRRPNIDQTYAKAFGEIIGLAYEDGIPRNAQASMGLDYRQKKA